MKMRKEIEYNNKNYVFTLVRAADCLKIVLHAGDDEAEAQVLDCFNRNFLACYNYNYEEENFDDLREKYLNLAFSKLQAALEKQDQQYFINLLRAGERYWSDFYPDIPTELGITAAGVAYEIYLEHMGELEEAVQETLNQATQEFSSL